ncbi:MAG: LacI family DNA-binding transcriptional regulator [Opitutaceae bacterium]|nr:LacI family DNA-binding transcriptional regulator [Opitutaceae bacterium]
MGKKATFYELAKLAKVSAATVSRIAAGKQNVDPKIRERVRQAAAQLGIDLEKKRDETSRIIAFVLANRDILHSFQARVLAGAESYVSANNWELVFLTFRYPAGVPAKELHLPQILSRRTPARGVILAGVNSVNLLHALRERQVPFSVLGNNLIGGWEQDPCDVVCSDDIQGAFDVTSHLLAQHHRHIWFIGDTRLPWYTRCGEGYRRAMEGAGLPPRLCDIHSDGRELGYLGAKSILSRREPVTAIFAGSDHVAGGVYAALRESGVAVPGDISVVGFNDSEAALFHPSLTSVREFPEELGRHLAEFTLNRIRQPWLPPQRLTIPTQLISRESTRALLPAAAEPARAR